MEQKKIKPMNLIFAAVVLVMFGGMEVLLVLTGNVPPPMVQVCLIAAILIVCLACVFPEGALALIKGIPSMAAKAKSLVSFTRKTEVVNESPPSDQLPKPPTGP